MLSIALAALLVPVSQDSVDLIVRYEVGSEARYTARYQRPICPGLHSGPTIGIGSDLGTQAERTIRLTWADHPQVGRLTTASGATGSDCAAARDVISDVVTRWPLALDVFERVDLVRYWRIARRSFGDGFAELPSNAQGALVSVVYNRGGSTVGSARREYREIRDVCIPERDEACIAAQIEAMCRLWRGGSFERGLCGRRSAEAKLIAER